MPKRWLVKTDPARLPLEILERGTVPWGGVTQPLSLGHLERMRRGDDVFVYHTGALRAVVGTARVRKGAHLDSEGALQVTLGGFAALDRPVPLAELRSSRSLADWIVVRMPRIHVAPVPAKVWRAVLARSRRPDGWDG